MLAIKNNIMAGNAARHLGKAYDSLATSVERLASGLRINSAKDDAAGLAVRELIRADVAVLQQGARNAQDGISMLQTMEGAMAVMDDNLIRMKELAEQAATGSYSAGQRVIMNAEFAEMADEIDRIAGATKFNDIAMLNATGTVEIHVGTTDTISVSKQDMRTTTTDGLNIEVGTSGWSLTSNKTVGETSLTDDWLTLVDAGSAAGTITITFQNEAALTVTLTSSTAASDAAAGHSITNVIEAINAVSLNLNVAGDGTVQAYTAASSIRDDDGTYQLRLDSRTTGAGNVAMAMSGGVDAVTGAFTEETGDMLNTTNFTTAAGAGGTGINIATTSAAVAALVRITTAINTKDTARAAFGYKMNRLESTIAILDVQAENLMSAESRISDVDVATEMATLTRTQVLSQAGIAMLSQANQMPQMALSLLR